MCLLRLVTATFEGGKRTRGIAQGAEASREWAAAKASQAAKEGAGERDESMAILGNAQWAAQQTNKKTDKARPS